MTLKTHHSKFGKLHNKLTRSIWGKEALFNKKSKFN